MESILEIKDLKKSYYTDNGEILALDNITFDLQKGKFLAIVGPSGCGKSTLLSILCGLEKETSGKITLNENIKIGYMPQDDALFSWRNVLNNCCIGLEISKTKNKSNIKNIIDLLNKYGLKDFIYKYPHELSGGMRQRVSLIRNF